MDTNSDFPNRIRIQIQTQEKKFTGTGQKDPDTEHWFVIQDSLLELYTVLYGWQNSFHTYS